jgi:hypothetical protein
VAEVGVAAGTVGVAVVAGGSGDFDGWGNGGGGAGGAGAGVVDGWRWELVVTRGSEVTAYHVFQRVEILPFAAHWERAAFLLFLLSTTSNFASFEAMAIQKQAFYEGAALHMITRAGGVTNVLYEAPFFLLNNWLLVFLKYSTKNRSPWGFTFTSGEQLVLANRGANSVIKIGLVCGSDGVATLSYNDFRGIASKRDSAVRVACFRKHNEHYEIYGPKGVLNSKVPPSMWQKILEQEEPIYAAS